MLFLNCDEVFILLHLFHNSSERPDIFIDLSVHQGYQKRAADLLHCVQRFLIVIQVNQPRYQTLFLVHADIPVDLCLVEHVESNQISVLLFHIQKHIVFQGMLQIHLADVHSEIHVLCGKTDYFTVSFVLPEQLFPGELRKEPGNRLAKPLFCLSAGLKKGCICPLYPSLIIQKRIGQRQIFQQLFLNLSILGGK